MTKQQQEQADARSNLIQWIKPGDTVYTVLRRVSRSGMQREIGIVLIQDRCDCEMCAVCGGQTICAKCRMCARCHEHVPGCPGCRAGAVRDLHPNYAVAKLLGMRLNKRGDGIVIGGCGYDTGFEIVYQLGRALFRDGFTCTGPDCHSNDHSNGDRDYTPHPHSDPGYALTQRWL